MVNQVEEKVIKLEEEISLPVVNKPKKVPVNQPKGPLRLGEKIHLKSIAQDGVVMGIDQEEVEVQIGVLRVRARLSDVARKGIPSEEPEKSMLKAHSGKTTLPTAHKSPGIEIDIRGQRVDDGLENLERYLEKAYLAGLPFVRIIHGKGTGKLRESVRLSLTKNHYVDRFEIGGDTEGGDGVTIAYIKRQ